MVCSRGRLLLPIGPGRDARARATNPTLPFFMITIESKNSKNINTCETEVFNYQMDGSKGQDIAKIWIVYLQKKPHAHNFAYEEHPILPTKKIAVAFSFKANILTL